VRGWDGRGVKNVNETPRISAVVEQTPSWMVGRVLSTPLWEIVSDLERAVVLVLLLSLAHYERLVGRGLVN
jgi:hypothetical protein